MPKNFRMRALRALRLRPVVDASSRTSGTDSDTHPIEHGMLPPP
jgi:hypothetical protein